MISFVHLPVSFGCFSFSLFLRCSSVLFSLTSQRRCRAHGSCTSPACCCLSRRSFRSTDFDTFLFNPATGSGLNWCTCCPFLSCSSLLHSRASGSCGNFLLGNGQMKLKMG